MTVTLRQATQAHQRGELAEAERIYRELINSRQARPQVYQNLGALLREKGKTSEALSIYKQGLDAHPNDPGILANRANITKETQPASTLLDIFDALKADPSLVNSWITAIAILVNLDCNDYALHVARQALTIGCTDTRLILQVLDLLWRRSERDAPIIDQQFTFQILEALKSATASLPLPQRIDTLMAIAFHCADHGYSEQGTSFYQQAIRLVPNKSDQHSSREWTDIQSAITKHSWNMACMLLKEQEFAHGWKLYDYGLRTPTKTPQQWQRALRKPFSITQLPIWRGESLHGKTLLLLEEQGIGDTMMFLTLLPTLLTEAQRVDVIVSDRLAPIYRRVFSGQARIWTHQEFQDEGPSPDAYAYQTALGSIPQHRFLAISDYAPQVPMLTTDSGRVDALRQKYLSSMPSPGPKKLIGVSWSGGGTKSRVRNKSMPLPLFSELLQAPKDVLYVSLQYGDVSGRVASWREQGIQIIHDPDVDPLLDMDYWLHQVAACDAVLSVANTTIHGAGGLNIPTMCLLSQHSDWRWLRDPSVQRSYWYPSVGIARQADSGDWHSAVEESLQWISSGCPFPSGASSKPSSSQE